MILIYFKRSVLFIIITGNIFAQNISAFNPEQNKFLIGTYFKSKIGYSYGLKSINSGINEIKTESQTVFIRPGSGINALGSIGIFIYNNICLEIGAGYFTNIKQFTNGTIQFHKYPIFGNLLYHIALSGTKHFYIGAGAGEYLLPNFITKVNDHVRSISYTHVKFASGTIGFRSNFGETRSFWFTEIKYSSCKRPTTTVETFNSQITEIEENFLLPSFDGINFNFGIGFGL